MMRAGEPEKFLQDLSSLFEDLPCKQVIPEEDAMLRNGNYLTYPASEIGNTLGQEVRMYTSDGEFVGLYKVTELLGDMTRMRSYKMFV